MSFTRRACVLAVMVGLMPASQADETKAPPAKPATPIAKTTAPVASAKKPPAAAKPAPVPEADDELLEFLGSVDEGDEDWIEYLSQTDIAKVAKGQGQRESPKQSPKENGEK